MKSELVDFAHGGDGTFSRRGFFQSVTAMGALASLDSLLPDYARTQQLPGRVRRLEPRRVDGVAVFDLEIAESPILIENRRAKAITINGTVPGPLLEMREGEEIVLRVTNHLRKDTSIHWHGVIVPPEMDGVPGVSFPGITPGATFEYRFPLRQYGTYWYHSHSGLQEQIGHYGPLVIHPANEYPYDFDRAYIVMLSDWTFEDPYDVLAKLKKQGNYYNRQRLTLGDFFKDVSRMGLSAAVRDRVMWNLMRMDPTDISDVTGVTYTYLMNGLAPDANWTGLFSPGERVLLRFINAGAATYFDIRIPGLPLTIVQSDGQFVEPVETDELRIAIAETYDVIVEPLEARAYTIFAEVMDRSGYARGTLAPRAGMEAPIPARRKRPRLTMAEMGMAHDGMAHGEMAGMAHDTAAMTHDTMPGMKMPARPRADTSAAAGHMGHEMPGMTNVHGMTEGEPQFAVAGAIRTGHLRAPGTLPGMVEHESRTHGPGNAAVPDMVSSRMSSPGIGLGEDGWRVLTYTQLRALEQRPDFRAPDREIEMHLTGNMERFMWSIDGKSFPESEIIHFTYGERIRLTMVNDTMMNHPMHLHGMWMELENGHRERIPRVHTVNVQPAERLSVLIDADAPGGWAFHCHILYHMDVGMFRVVEVLRPGERSRLPNPKDMRGQP